MSAMVCRDRKKVWSTPGARVTGSREAPYEGSVTDLNTGPLQEEGSLIPEALSPATPKD